MFGLFKDSPQFFKNIIFIVLKHLKPVSLIKRATLANYSKIEMASTKLNYKEPLKFIFYETHRKKKNTSNYY